MSIITCIGIGYFFGSFLTASVVARLTEGKDVSSIGTGNPGMANIMSNIGIKEGFIVLIGDILKVIAAFFLVRLLTRGLSFREIVMWTGFSAILGHDFPLWRKFRGGKGVTVTCTWMVFMMPLWGSLACAAGGIITLLTGYLPIGGILIPLLGIPFAFIFMALGREFS